MRGVVLDPKTGRPEARSLLAERALADKRFHTVLDNLERAQQLDQELGLNQIRAADGNYYHDSRPPFYVVDMTAITGTTEALLWPAGFSLIPAGYFAVGKMIRIFAYGRITTAGATPGNITLTTRYGTTTGGTSLGATTATALIASATNIPWRYEALIVCRAVGPTGSLLIQGKWETTSAVIASPSTLFLPASAPAAVTVDTTVSSGIVVGATLGSASDTMQTHNLVVESLN